MHQQEVAAVKQAPHQILRGIGALLVAVGLEVFLGDFDLFRGGSAGEGRSS